MSDKERVIVAEAIKYNRRHFKMDVVIPSEQVFGKTEKQLKAAIREKHPHLKDVKIKSLEYNNYGSSNKAIKFEVTVDATNILVKYGVAALVAGDREDPIASPAVNA